MKHVIETGTDAATLAVFDSAALPDDFDVLDERQTDALRDLHDKGELFCIESGGDGGFLFHVFVEESFPSYLTPFLHDPIETKCFKVPSGKIYCSGAEYAFRKDRAGLKENPGMGGSFTVPVGIYRATVLRAEYPENLMEDELKQSVSSLAFKAHQNVGCFVGLAFLSLIFLLLAFFKFTQFILFAAILAFVLMAVPFLIFRSHSYAMTKSLWDEIESKYPSIVVMFQPQ